MILNKEDKSITHDALHQYWHYVVNMLDKKDLGDIQRANLELDKKQLDDLLSRFN